MDTICVATAEVQDNNATPLQQHPNGYVTESWQRTPARPSRHGHVHCN